MQVELSGVGRKWGSVCEPRRSERGRDRELLQVDVVKYEEKGFDVIVMGDFNARIGLRAEEHPNSNGKRLLKLVRARDLIVGNQLQCCDGRWTWEVV